MTKPHPRRTRELAKIRRHLERFSSPRLQMMLIVGVAASAGFLASFALLVAGVESMALRYPLALLAAYAVFLFELSLWLRWGDEEPSTDWNDSTSSSDRHASSATDCAGAPRHGGGDGADFCAGEAAPGDLSLGDVGLGDVSLADAADLEALPVVVVLFLLAVLVAGLLLIVNLVWAAPVLLAEITLDAALAAGLYRRLRRTPDDRHWLESAVRRTIKPLLLAAVLLALAGGVMQAFAPAASTLGDAIAHWSAA